MNKPRRNKVTAFYVHIQKALLKEVEAVGLHKIVHDNAMGFWIGVRSPCDNGTTTIAIGIIMPVCILCFDVTVPPSCLFASLTIRKHTDKHKTHESFTVCVRVCAHWCLLVLLFILSIPQGYSDTGPFGNCTDENSTPAVVSDIVPSGSLTKTFTAAAIMRAIDAGMKVPPGDVDLHLDGRLLDMTTDFLRRVLVEGAVPNASAATLETLFGPGVANLTLRMALSMMSGLHEYNDRIILDATETQPLWDISPSDYLANKTLTPRVWRCPNYTSSCNPPTYVSTNFLFAGLVLGQLYNSSRWEDLDQLAAAIPSRMLNSGRYNGTYFFKHGTCASYPGVAHYYMYRDSKYVDQFRKSCLNGWAFGNVGITALDAATFVYDLLAAHFRARSNASSSPYCTDITPANNISAILSPNSMEQMTTYGQVLAGHKWETYGLGLMNMPLERYGRMNLSVPGTLA